MMALYYQMIRRSMNDLDMEYTATTNPRRQRSHFGKFAYWPAAWTTSHSARAGPPAS